PAAAPHLPPFVTAPGETDVLMVAMGVFLLLAVVGIGVFYFTLHSIPERMAHRTSKVQFEIVAVLGLLALLTHQHIFWVAALLLAMISIPDFLTPMQTMALSLQKMASDRGRPLDEPLEPVEAQSLAEIEQRVELQRREEIVDRTLPEPSSEPPRRTSEQLSEERA
ncbi:MAG TPA: hypothetical protein VMP03_08935, partial [Methylomirabilota bacterium]|nr:hypothetical protein [Methylomirabilota bacterium]